MVTENNSINGARLPFRIADDLESLKNVKGIEKLWDATRPKLSTYTLNSKLGLLGDFATEWWTQEDWDKHELYIDKLKREGTYLFPVTYKVSLVHNPDYDDRSLLPAVTSASFTMLDFSKI